MLAGDLDSLPPRLAVLLGGWRDPFHSCNAVVRSQTSSVQDTRVPGKEEGLLNVTASSPALAAPGSHWPCWGSHPHAQPGPCI